MVVLIVNDGTLVAFHGLWKGNSFGSLLQLEIWNVDGCLLNRARNTGATCSDMISINGWM